MTGAHVGPGVHPCLSPEDCCKDITPFSSAGPVPVDGVSIRRSPVEVGSLSHYLQGVLAPSKRWLGMGFQPSTVPFPYFFVEKFWIWGQVESPESCEFRMCILFTMKVEM